MSSRSLISQLLANGKFITGRRCEVSGYVKRVRDLKNHAFIHINDGSCPENIQVVVDKTAVECAKVSTGDSIRVSGTVVPSAKDAQEHEIQASRIQVSATCDDDFPLHTKNITADHARKFPHLQFRVPAVQSMMRLRSVAEMSVHNFYSSKHFTKIQTPVLTTNDCEGAGECFSVIAPNDSDKTDAEEQFFGSRVQLVVSGQLHLEAAAYGAGNVYCFGPAFRAENSRTARHLAEFTMVEAELSDCADLTDLASDCEGCIKYVIDHLLSSESKLLRQFWASSKIENPSLQSLKDLLSHDFVRMHYREAIKVLSEKFSMSRGDPLSREHELFLCDFVRKPIFILNFPSSQKPFYMRKNDDEESCASFDLLAPRVGEIAGGGLREERIEVLDERINQMENPQKLQWYLDLRRFGMGPHGGYGIGFERLLMMITGANNIKNTLPFPRFSRTCQL